MREKELRLALICYGGISLAVYMHGITKEVWRLAKASCAFHEGAEPAEGSQRVYRALLESIEENAGLKLRVLADIIAGASAGGINGVFLAQALASGESLEPLTDLWLEQADVEKLLDPDARPVSAFTKFWAMPIAWVATGRRGSTIEETVAPETRAEVRRKLSQFVRARWFAPPFGGLGFTEMLLDAFEAMQSAERGPTLLPAGQPLDLFVTVTDFRGHPERLRLNSPPEVVETEHRLVLRFRHSGSGELAHPAELAFAARATASFPGAFPPFTIAELDKAMEARSQPWPGRDDFLRRALPQHSMVGAAEKAVLIDGSVLANAPFRPAIDALKGRPARREIDRRFVYIDPKPGIHSIGFGGAEGDGAPGFFQTVLGALSDLPRTQPIRDNLEAIEGRSSRIRRTRQIVEAIRPQVDEEVQTLFGRTFFLDRPTEARLTTWRAKAQSAASKQAGHAFAAYGQLKLSGAVDEIARTIVRLTGAPASRAERFRQTLWRALGERGLERVMDAGGGANPAAIDFFRAHDLRYRIRRLRFLARTLSEMAVTSEAPTEAIETMRDSIYRALAPYLDREIPDFYGGATVAILAAIEEEPVAALERLAMVRDLVGVDAAADARIADGLAALPKPERRTMLLAYLGFPFYDIATLPLLQGEGLDEFDPVKVDRIAPDDATAIRAGGAEATLKGVQFNSFGAFFCRAYRENDYLWGRLHGAERLIDIVVSTLPPGQVLPPGTVAGFKRRAFLAILDEEEPRLKAVPELFAQLRKEIG